MSANPRVTVAVVGCGYIAQAEHIPCLLRSRGCALAAIVEPRPATRAALAERLGVPGFATIHQLLADGPDVEAVDVCAVPRAHGPLIEAAVTAGKHVLVEKPLCHSPSEGRAIVELVERRGVRLMVGYMRRFDDVVLEAKRRLASGEIGRLKTIATVFKLALPATWHRVADFEPEAAAPAEGAPERPAADGPDDLLPADEIIEQSLHHINLIRFLGGEVRSLGGVHVAPGNVHLLMGLEGGAVANHSHVGRSGHGEEFWLYGEKGMMHARLWSPHFPYRFPELTLFGGAEAGGRTAEERRLVFPIANPYQQELEAFAALVRGGGPQPCTAADALRDLEVIARIHEAAGRPPVR